MYTYLLSAWILPDQVLATQQLPSNQLHKSSSDPCQLDLKPKKLCCPIGLYIPYYMLGTQLTPDTDASWGGVVQSAGTVL